MKKYIFLLLFTIIGYPFALYAQFDPKPQIQKPSADAQSLGKFGEIPVDLFTGRVNINIPIYSIKYYDIDVPISISYHGGGIKTSEECGSVGLGWTLNVGGVINRIVRGMPDNLLDNTNKIAGFEKLNNLTLTNGLNQFTSFIDLIKQRNPERDPTSLRLPITSEEIYLTDMISKYGDAYDNGHFDTAPDNYSFNVQGLSGVFIHKNLSGVILQSNDGVTVSRPNNLSYTITDANGYIYQFQDVEEQTYSYKSEYGWYMDGWDGRPEYYFKYPSSFWLSSITSPTGETVHFYYTDSKIIYPRPSFYGVTDVERRRSPDGTFYHDTHEFCTGGSYAMPVSDTTYKSKLDTTYKKILNRIETPNSIVRFYYENDNFFYHSLKLDSVVVFARSDLDKMIEKTEFAYGGAVEPRLLLQRLTKYGTNNNNEQTYRFSYKSSSANPSIDVNDNRSDHWGYFSPASTGRFSLKPYFFGMAVSLANAPYYTDRYANDATADDCMLTKIIYPTAGSTELVWEPHSYSQLSKLGARAPRDRTSADEITHHTEYHIETTLSLCGKSANEILSASHTVNSQRTVVVDLSSYYPPINFLGNYENTPQNCINGWYDGDNFNVSNIGDRPHIRVKKDGELIRLIHLCSETYQNPVILEASSGTYTFELWNPRSAFNTNCCAECSLYYDDYFNRYGADSSNYGYVKIQFGYEDEQTSGSKYQDVGGVRIKRITNKSADNVALIKEFDYVQDPSDPSSASSGILSYPPRYGSLLKFCETVHLGEGIKGGGVIITECTDLLTLRSNGLPYTLNGGSHIEYSKVIESVVQTPNLSINDPLRKSLRKTIYSYWTGADDGHSDIDDTGYGIYIPSDMLQLTSQNYQRGHLKEKTEYTDEKKTYAYNYEIIEPTTTDVIIGSLFTIGDYTKTSFLYNDGQGGSVKPYKDLGIVKYRIIPYNKRLKSVTAEGSKSNSYEAYTYANNVYSDARGVNSPLSHTTVDSEGNAITQHFTYVNANLNRVHTCVTDKEGKVIDAYRNEYDTSGRIIEKYIALLDPDNLPLANSYNVDSRTNKLVESYLYNRDRLVQLIDHQSGISTVYLWSYNGTYPVAEIQNATFNNVCTLLGNSVVENLFNTYTPDMSLLNGLRNTLQESQISTMTYKLLIGIISFTDPKGRTTYFDYDGFGKLKENYIIENNRKKIIQKMEYHWTY